MDGDLKPGSILGTDNLTVPCHFPAIPDITITFVLVAGSVNDYACYVGVGSPDWVKQHGNKVNFEEAELRFPWAELERKRYRV